MEAGCPVAGGKRDFSEGVGSVFWLFGLSSLHLFSADRDRGELYNVSHNKDYVKQQLCHTVITPSPTLFAPNTTRSVSGFAIVASYYQFT